MNIAVKILVSGLGIALVACGASAPGGIAEAARAISDESAKAQDDSDARVADSHAAARREINRAVLKQSLARAKVDYRKAIANADRDLSVALEKCATQAARTHVACETDARSGHDRSAETAKMKLSLADQ
jgi:hypothetical protein